jgi:hypothetical protein
MHRSKLLARRPSFDYLARSGYVLDVAGPDRPIAQSFAELGKLMLMFYAGLEIHFDQAVSHFRSHHPHHAAGARHRVWSGIWLFRYFRGCYRLAARIAHPD